MDDDGESGSVSVRATCGLPTGVEPARIADALRSAARAAGLEVSGLHVVLVDDVEMDRLHRSHAGVAGPTDVLTFPHSEPGEPIEADAALCVDEAARRASDFGHAVERELLLYAVHALLHCAGHDDHEPAAHARMHAEEDRILEAIGVGATFLPRRDEAAP